MLKILLIFSFLIYNQPSFADRCGALFHELTALARSSIFTNPKAVPGYAGGLIRSNAKGRYLLSYKLRAEDLPYSTSMREDNFNAANIPENINGFRKIEILGVTDVFVTSSEHGGSGGIVKLAYLPPDGRPVITKTYAPMPGRTTQDTNAKMLTELRSAKAMSDMGVGAKFHGYHVDEAGKTHIVSDFVPGDFSGDLKYKTLMDIEEMLSRLEKHKFKDLFDLQGFINSDGRFMLIDPGQFINGHNAILEGSRNIPSNDRFGQFTRFRMPFLKDANKADLISYLKTLKSSNRTAFDGVIEALDAEVQSTSINKSDLDALKN